MLHKKEKGPSPQTFWAVGKK